jgi:hypothetical protein
MGERLSDDVSKVKCIIIEYREWTGVYKFVTIMPLTLSFNKENDGFQTL